MKGILLIDPSAITAMNLEVIHAYLYQYPDFSGVFNDRSSGAIYSCTYNGKVINFQLASRLILREKSKCCGQYHFQELAVVGGEIGAGRYGVVNDISGSISLVLRPADMFGYKVKHQRSIVKKQYHFADYPAKFAINEFNILRLTDYAKHKNYYLNENQFSSHIIARKISGNSLAQILNNESFDNVGLLLDERMRMSVNILRALKEGVHDRGIVHRDIKPENIIVNAKLAAFLIDFGLSRKAGKTNNDGARCGTISFISPDFAIVDGDGQSCLDEKSDIYSIGKLLSLVWGANNPIASNRFKDIAEVIEFVRQGENPALFARIPIPSGLSEIHKDKLASIISGMMSVSRRKRMSLNDAIAALEDLRLSVLAGAMSREEAHDFFAASAIVSELRHKLFAFQQSPEYSLMAMIKIITSYAERIPGGSVAVREFRLSLGICSANNELTKLDLLNQLQSFTYTVGGFEGIFHGLILAIDEQIKKEKYLSQAKSDERLANLSHIRKLILHELDKLIYSRRDYSDLENLQDKLDTKLHYFSRVIRETSYISGWVKHCDLREMIHCMDTFCDDLRPDYLNSLSRFKLDLAQVIHSFTVNYEASHHYSLFHEPAKMPGSAVRYAGRLFVAIVHAVGDEELAMAIRELVPPKNLFHSLERQLYARLLHVIDHQQSWPSPVSMLF